MNKLQKTNKWINHRRQINYLSFIHLSSLFVFYSLFIYLHRVFSYMYNLRRITFFISYICSMQSNMLQWHMQYLVSIKANFWYNISNHLF